MKSFCSEKRLIVNTKKESKYMCAAKKAKSNVPPVCYNGEILERVTHFTYLGVTFSSSNNFNNGLKEVAKQISRSQAGLDQHVLRHLSVTPIMVSHRGHNCIFSALTILDSALTSQDIALSSLYSALS